MEKQKIDGNIQGQTMSNEQTHKNTLELKKIEIAIEKQKIDAEFRLESKKHRYKMDQIPLEKRMEAGGDLLVAAKRGQYQIKTAVIKSLVAHTKTNGKDSNSTKKVAKNN